MKIPKIDRRPLPAQLPTPEVIKSFGQNEHAYHPDFWELEYSTYRYLGRMSDDELRDRYREIIRNMQVYAKPERDVIPIKSFDSSWYWFRKEYQTRLEFALRELSCPSLTQVSSPSDVPVPMQMAFPSGSKVIYRYGKRVHMHEMVNHGRVRFSPAQNYEDEENNAARKDDELQKKAYMPGQYTTVILGNGQEIKVIGDVQYSVEGPDYHLVCFSCIWDTQLFHEFEADICVAVINPDEFSRRLGTAGETVFPGWYFHDCLVQYFDPYERSKDEYFNSSMSKDFRFAYQWEYRILWSQMSADPVEGYRFIDIGPANDIMKMYDINGNEIVSE